MKKKIISLILLAVTVFGLAIMPASAETEKKGTLLTADEYYAVEEAYSSLPFTCEAWIKFTAQKRSGNSWDDSL